MPTPDPLSPDSQEFADLVAAVCHNTASDEQLSRLTSLLDGNVEAQTEYLRQVDLHATLAADDTLFAEDDIARMSAASGDTGDGIRLPGQFDITSAPRPNLPGTSRSNAGKALLFTIAAALIAAAFLLFALLRTDTNTETPEDLQKPDGIALASVTRSYQAVWEGEAPPADITGPMALRLQSGLVQFEFSNGAIILAEAPLEGEIISASAVRIDHGKIRVIIPSQSGGFTLYTDKVKLSGSDCEFGLSLNGIDKGEAHAFSGELEFIPSGKLPKRTLNSGEALNFRTDSDSSVRPVPRPAVPSDFVGLRELDEQARTASEAQHRRWMDYCRQRQSDPSLLVHYTFENFNPWDRFVTNTAAANGKKSDGAMVGCQWTRGRWPEKGAVDFHRPSHRIRLNLRSELTAFTMTAWVNIPEVPADTQVLFSSTGASSPEWALGKNGSLLLIFRNKDAKKNTVIRSKPVITSRYQGEWIHLAVVCDGESVSFYTNGEPAHKAALTGEITPPFVFGRSDIGNRSLPPAAKSKAREKARSAAAPFSGLMDEFQLTGRALSDAEILDGWKAGTPEL